MPRVRTASSVLALIENQVERMRRIATIARWKPCAPRKKIKPGVTEMQHLGDKLVLCLEKPPLSISNLKRLRGRAKRKIESNSDFLAGLKPCVWLLLLSSPIV